jgi:hypothetical protein
MCIEQGGPAHRYVALIILLSVVYVVAMSIVALLQHSRASYQRYEDAQLQLSKYKTVAESLPLVQAEQGHLAKLDGVAGHYIKNTTQAFAQASLQKKLQQLVQSSGANLIRMQAVQSKVDSGFLRITMKANLRLSHQALLSLVYQLESQTPAGFIYDIQIQRSGITKRQQQVTTEVEAALLDVDLEYTVFRVVSDDD